MPYVSEAQRNFFNSPAGKAKIGAAEVAKWNAESKGQASNADLPKHVKKAEPTRKTRRWGQLA